MDVRSCVTPLMTTCEPNTAPATAAPASYRATARAAGRARRCAHIIWRALALLWADYARSRPSKADTRERSYSVRHEGPLRPMTRLT
jgi:hypothetical protein